MGALDSTVKGPGGQQMTFGNPGVIGLGAAQSASKKWHVPMWVLWGVYGMETDFGRNIKTSSAGAVGPMQFLPSTWATYGHGRNINDIPSAMDAAGEYLSTLYNQNGHSWDRALRAYSGGGYGQQQVQAKAKSTGQGNNPVGQAANAVGGAVSGAVNAAKGVGDLVTALMDPHTWIRVAEVIGGMTLLLLALKEITGGSIDPIGMATGAARSAMP